MDMPSDHTEITSLTKKGSLSAELDQPCNNLPESIQDNASVNRRMKEVNFNLPSIEINDYTEEEVMTKHGNGDDKGEETKECEHAQYVDPVCQDSVILLSNTESTCLAKGSRLETVSLPLDSKRLDTNTSDDYDVCNGKTKIILDGPSVIQNSTHTNLSVQMVKGNSVEVHYLGGSEPSESLSKSEISLGKTKTHTFDNIEETVSIAEVANLYDRHKQSHTTAKDQSSNKMNSEVIPLETNNKEMQGTGGQVSKVLSLPGKYGPQELKENVSNTFDISEINRQSQVTSGGTPLLPSHFLPPNLSLNSQQHVQTQVSLEVMCRSAATSPMTPPEGIAAAFFPYLSGKLELSCKELAIASKKDAELQVGKVVESRSVATAPMSPMTPNAPEDSYPKIDFKSNVEDNQQEPVQAINWDEKGMTWEVYGAAVEVEVLGIAIQKHLEKQIKDHKKFPPPSLPSPHSMKPAIEEAGHPVASPPSSPPPVSTLSSNVLTKEPGKAQEKREAKKKTRLQRNPFRVALRGMHRPRCCFRTSTIE
uniref:G protein-regulated inducer of neurite outgrowth C-terminal domain-containing protein n=1 Tax=Scleropages formosus TaxID=113540 RepID=A0A8C9W242_SCLFO